MRTRDLILTCGTTLTLVAASVLAQQGQPGDRSPTDRTVRPGQPADRPDSTRRDVTTTRASDATPSILNKLEGVWRVDVTVNPDLWGDRFDPKQRDMQTDPARRDTRTDPDRPAGQRPDYPGTPDEPKPETPPTTRRDATQPRDTTQPRDAARPTQPDSLGASKTCTGYSERRLVLGDNILQETIVIPDVNKTMKDSDRTAPGRTPDLNVNGDSFRGMSFMSFNPSTNKYTMVFMDSRHGDMHHHTGTYDATQNRIVFHGGRDGTGSSAHGTTPGTYSDPADFGRQPGGVEPDVRISHHGFGDVRVVLDVTSNDQHRVTMYKVSGPVAVRPADRDPAMPDNRPNEERRNVDQPRDLEGWTPLAGRDTIVYQATYTRATGAEASRYQQQIRQDDALTRVDRNR